MARFNIYVDIAGGHRWRLIANNGEKVAASEAYASRQGAIRSAKRVKELASMAIVEE